MTATPSIPMTCLASARLCDSELIVSNPHFERRWRVLEDQASLQAISWTAADATPFLSPADCATTTPPALAVGYRLGKLHVEKRNPEPGVCGALAVEIPFTHSASGSQVCYRLEVFDDAPGVSIQCRTTKTADDPARPRPATALAERQAELLKQAAPDCVDGLVLPGRHHLLTHYQMADTTDHHDNLCRIDTWRLSPSELTLLLAGNVFAVEDPLTGRGIIVLKQAPLPHARPVKSEADLGARLQQIAVLGHGIDPSDPTEQVGDACVTLIYTGGEKGRIRTLHRYQRLHRPYVPSRDGQLLSNTWGDRNRDGRINHHFMLEEIASAASLGVDIQQIDDGWQQGASMNSVDADAKGGVWTGFYDQDPNFWQPHPERFPDGLEPVVAEAQRAGLEIGLWFAPDSSNDFAHWRDDADQLLRYHEQLGIRAFKIDAVVIRSKVGQANLNRFFAAVRDESHHQIVLDLDITAGVRPGYFGAMGVGPLFLENRYAGAGNYYPHATLRNLWQLSHVLPPSRLRLEFLNPRRSPEPYADDPLAPWAYRWDTLFAITLLTHPLGWFECSGLAEEDIALATPLIARWKEHRHSLHTADVYPIGQAPDGVAWTGFLVEETLADQRHLLIFRERNPRDAWQITLDRPAHRCTVLAGQGSAQLAPAGDSVTIRIDAPLAFAWITLT